MIRLEALDVPSQDIYEIDRRLAEKLADISGPGHLIAGASWDAGVPLPKRVRTGGVLGCPDREIASAAGEVEALPEGFSLFALPGGPGLAALAPEERTKRVLQRIQAEGFPDEAAILSILFESGISAGLLVFDGTGAAAYGYVLAFSEGRFESASL